MGNWTRTLVDDGELPSEDLAAADLDGRRQDRSGRRGPPNAHVAHLLESGRALRTHYCGITLRVM